MPAGAGVGLTTPRGRRRGRAGDPEGSVAESPRDQRRPESELTCNSGLAGTAAGGGIQREVELMKRIEMIEAKVVDRDGLVARLSRQQARLDKLEALARENDILRAQVRGEHRRAEFGKSPAGKEQSGPRNRPSGAGSGRVSASGGAVGGQVRNDCHSPREMAPQPLPQQPLQVPRRGVSPPRPAKEVEQEDARGPAIFVSSYHHANATCPRHDSAGCAAMPRELKAVQSPRGAGVAATGPPLLRSELDSRLGELELALGLPLGGLEMAPTPAAPQSCRREHLI